MVDGRCIDAEFGRHGLTRYSPSTRLAIARLPCDLHEPQVRRRSASLAAAQGDHRRRQPRRRRRGGPVVDHDGRHEVRRAAALVHRDVGLRQRKSPGGLIGVGVASSPVVLTAGCAALFPPARVLAAHLSGRIALAAVHPIAEVADATSPLACLTVVESPMAFTAFHRLASLVSTVCEISCRRVPAVAIARLGDKPNAANGSTPRRPSIRSIHQQLGVASSRGDSV